LLVYWLLFGFFAAGALLTRGMAVTGRLQAPNALLLGAILVCLAVGLRYEVGGDWTTYEFWFTYARYADLGRFLEVKDPAYQLLNWSVQRLDLGFWVVNLVCAMIFTWGLYRFAKVQPDPWLAMVVAVPYLVIVVGMGYTRQAVAIGILMAGLASVSRGGSVIRFAIWVAAAALFHRTAVVALPLVALVGQRNRLVNLVAMAAASVLLYDMMLEDSMQGFVKNYIKAEYSSEGAMIRVVMNLIPAVLFLLFQRRLSFSDEDRALWRNFSLAAVALLVVLFISPSSTVVDRISLYILPLQIVVLCRVPGRLLASDVLGKLLVVIYACLIQFTWLNFASHAYTWLPYQFYPLWD
jgi:hypothetical protein